MAGRGAVRAAAGVKKPEKHKNPAKAANRGAQGAGALRRPQTGARKVSAPREGRKQRRAG